MNLFLSRRVSCLALRFIFWTNWLEKILT